MVKQLRDGQIFTLHHADADEVYLACDCLGWFPMHRIDESYWQVTLTLPPGAYHLRYYMKKGKTICWYGHEDLEIGSGSRSAPATSEEQPVYAESAPRRIR